MPLPLTAMCQDKDCSSMLEHLGPQFIMHGGERSETL
jgi:hypothetical protein